MELGEMKIGEMRLGEMRQHPAKKVRTKGFSIFSHSTANLAEAN